MLAQKDGLRAAPMLFPRVDFPNNNARFGPQACCCALRLCISRARARGPGADVGGVSPISVQMLRGRAQSRCRRGQGVSARCRFGKPLAEMHWG